MTRAAASVLTCVLAFGHDALPVEPSRRIALRCGRLIDGRGGPTVPGAVILVEGDTIRASDPTSRFRRAPRSSTSAGTPCCRA